MEEGRRRSKAFPPGDFIKEELDARGWTQTDLALILGRPLRVVNEILSGKRSISPETAQGLGDAFGTSAQLWLNLEASYQISRLSVDSDVVKRGAIYAKGPVKEMVRRRWIEGSDNVDDLVEQVLGFFQIKSLDEEANFVAATRAGSTESLTPAHVAWLFRAKQLAGKLSVDNAYSRDGLKIAVNRLRGLLSKPADVQHAAHILREAGVRFLVVEPLPRTRIDGACFWLDPSSPVVVLSLRFDRIDCFWFTLMHELGHVNNADGMTSLDTDLVGQKARSANTKSDSEKKADEFAVQSVVPKERLDDFIKRTRPLCSKARILRFASSVEVHPGIVVGQLQHRNEISYAHNREMLVKVRDHVMKSALIDGWGLLPEAALEAFKDSHRRGAESTESS